MNRRLSPLLVLIASLALVALWTEIGRPLDPEATLQILFLDVGQGDAVFIRSPEGRTVLIDGGRPARLVADTLDDLGVTQLDLVIASHADADHIGGLIEAVTRFRPRYFMDNGVPHTTQTYRRLLEAVDAAGSQYLEASERQLTLDTLTLQILPPTGPPGDQNENSVGVVLLFGTFRAAFLGDATTRSQQRWLARYPDYLSDLDLYKAAHHGARTGDTPEVMAVLRPAIVVISVGADNPYGHPTRQALDSYASVGARIYRTDEQGHVSVLVEPSGQVTILTGALPAQQGYWARVWARFVGLVQALF